ncbi:sugar ABC transporter substrate-binding protein [Conexibacter sp. JD483]|uniref:ABC transporter substrate-binding protein n=1 Tax=unclassified Conexibacter TaxID=2627773 RepID=UPI00271807BD|nr:MULTISPECIES: sugar ABC transporter substrate-binding protein [unclassified Conexibacter]MDO8184909.1 sugar ABC transporter substrate-binding protein [Conexibacter sp. CPCC 205706]MDO8198053.1 sugar ABC transporter substrate-binding protein [Conexibacter sp. CPCC 205762]MDR9372942.1 sugar ABC transporter substrate-binding protein [Conexibacter sp. JD483]
MTTSRRDFLRGGVAFGAAFATLPLLSACGSDDAGAALDPSKSATDLDGVKLKVLVNQPNLGAWRIAARLFEQETGATVELTPIPYDKLTSNAIRDVQSGAGEFDVFQYWYVGLGDLVDAGALENLTDFIDERRAEIRPEDFLPSIYDPYTLIDDRRWGLPFDGDTFLLFYNQELFDRFGVQPPQTWEQYADVTRTITGRGGGNVYGAAVMGQQVPIILGCTFADRLVGFGGRFLDDSGKPALTSPEAVAAAEALFAVSPDALPTPLQTGFDQAIPAFLSGRAAMMEFWTDLSVMASNPEQSRIVDSWRPIQLPVGGSNTTHGTSLNAGFGAAVSTLSKHKEAAAALVQFQASPRSQETVIGNFGTGADPIRRSTFAAPEFRRTFGQAAGDVQAGLSGQPLVWPNSVGAVDRLQTLVDELALGIQGKQSAREALQKAQDAWERG